MIYFTICLIYLIIRKDHSNVKENFVISPLVVHFQELKWPNCYCFKINAV